MPMPPRYKKGDTVRGLKLVAPSQKISGKDYFFSWICKDPKTGELHHLTTHELARHKRTPVSRFQAQLRRIFAAYRHRCRRRNNYFELTQDEFYKLTQKNCVYCGAKPSNGTLPYLYQGLDRKDSSLGYTKDNVVPCCAKCNGIKSNLLTYTEMLVAMTAIKRARG